jgi:hypothetical protein
MKTHIKAAAALAAIAGVVMAALAVSPALAHTANVTPSCTGVSFQYDRFPAGQSSASYVVKVDGQTVADGAFTVTGPSSGASVPLDLHGPHTVYAETSWTADGGGKASASAQLECPPLPDPKCPDGTSVFSSGPPLVCLKVETRTETVTKEVPVDRIVEKVVEKFGTPKCPDATTEVGRGDGSVVCERVVDRPVTVTKVVTRVVTKTVVRWKTKWKTRTIVKHKKCGCPPGTVLYKGHCAVQGSG